MADSSIEWTDKVWNCVRGCALVSEGCRNCYAMRQAYRFNGEGMGYDGLTHIVNGHPVWTGKIKTVESKLEDPLRWKKPCRIFVNSMSDLFHEDVPFDYIDKVFAVMALCSQHTFQILTKRPERMLEYCAAMISGKRQIGQAAAKLRHSILGAMAVACAFDPGEHKPSGKPPYTPLSNVWLGVSVENQKYADERIPLLLQTPAAVRWISYEPALGPVDFQERDQPEVNVSWLTGFDGSDPAIPGLDWVVCGGESGPGARPFDIQWAKNVIAQCKSAGVPVFIKQLGRFPHLLPSGINHETWQYNAYTHIRLKDAKGGEMSEWPEDLRVREYPQNPTP